MSASAHRGLIRHNSVPQGARANGGTNGGVRTSEAPKAAPGGAPTIKVFVAAENRLLREALARMLSKKGDTEVTGIESEEAFKAEVLARAKPDILLLASRGALAEDIATIRQVRAAAPQVRILVLGMPQRAAEFLQCVRAGISGYLLRDASSEEVPKAVRAVQAGEAVCPGTLCTALFRYFESETASLPCVSAHRRLGLTRREQQLIPLAAQGLTNKEIANHFSLSEQTVKNHLYRMKHKIGAEDRLDIVQVYRTQGFLV